MGRHPPDPRKEPDRPCTVRTRHVIDTAGADAVIAAAEEAAAAHARTACASAVVDPSGEVVAMRRTQGAQVASARVAVDKARTAAIFVRPSRVRSRSRSRAAASARSRCTAPSCLTGGIPLKVGDEVVGAVGTSGETPDEDEAISIAGAAAALLHHGGPRADLRRRAPGGRGRRRRGRAARRRARRLGRRRRRRARLPLRPDAAQVASVQVTTDKARTAAIYRRPSKDFEDQASGGRPSALHLARRGPAAGRDADRRRRRGHRRGRRQRRARRPTRTRSSPAIGVEAVAAAA